MIRRPLALLAGTWLVLLLAEPAALHVCAVHGGGSGHSAAAFSHHDAPGHTRDHHPGHHHSAQCSCLSASSHSSLVGLPSAGEALIEVAAVAATTPVRVNTDAPAPAQPDHLLPYPNGPPAAIAA